MRAFIQDNTHRNTNILTTFHRTTHTYLIGQPGTGKSKAIESWVMQDVAAGRGVVVIDPHGDLFRNLLLHISNRREVWDRVLIIDPCNQKWVVGFNPLAPISGIPQERIALYLTDVVMKLWSLSPTSAPRMIWLLTNSFLALSELELTLLDLPRLLLDQDFRHGCISRLHNENTRNYFLYEFPQSRGAIHQWVTPVLNKIGGLLFDPDIRPMFEKGRYINFRDVMDRKHILLVNLPKGILGESVSSLIAAFIVARIQQAALSRANIQKRESFYLYLDEFQNYTTDNIEDILTESRKYALSLTLAHQYLDQLPTRIKSAVRNTAGTLISFRVGYQDAYRLSKDIFPSADFLASNRPKLTVSQSGLFPQFKIKDRKDGKGWENLAQALTKLRTREFWCRRRGSNLPTRHRTIFMPDPIVTKKLEKSMQELIDFSGQRFGRLKHVPNTTPQKDNSFRHDGIIPLWDE